MVRPAGPAEIPAVGEWRATVAEAEANATGITSPTARTAASPRRSACSVSAALYLVQAVHEAVHWLIEDGTGGPARAVACTASREAPPQSVTSIPRIICAGSSLSEKTTSGPMSG